MYKYNASFLKDSEDTDREERLFNIKKFKSNFLNLEILNSSFLGVLERLEARYLANISLIVLVLVLAYEDSIIFEELLDRKSVG